MPAFNHQNNFWLKLERGHEARGYVIAATFSTPGPRVEQQHSEIRNPKSAKLP
jgi:hypothetical protein